MSKKPQVIYMSRSHFLKGAFLLTAAGFISRIMGFFYRIFLSHTIGAEGIGLYQLLVPFLHLVLAMTTSGIQTALSRLVSSHAALGEEKEARDIFCLGTLLAFGLSAVASWIFFTFADFWASQIIREPASASLIRILSFSFPFAAIHACVNSYFLGLKKASWPAVIQLLEQAVRIFSSWIIYQICLSAELPVTASIAIGGAFLSEFAAALFSLIFISLHLHDRGYSFFRMNFPLKKITAIHRLAFPLTLNRLLFTVLSAIEAVMIPQQLRAYGLTQTEALSLYGIFTGMALPCILFPATAATSVSVMLIPSVAEMQALGYRKRIRSLTRQTYAACILLGTLCTALFYIFGPFAGSFLFHDHTAGLYIRTLSFICPFLYTNITLTSILNGLGKTGRTLLHSVIGILLRISFVVVAVPAVGIRGYLYGLLLSEILLNFMHINALYHMEL